MSVKCTQSGCSAEFETVQQANSHLFSAHVRVRELSAIRHGTVAGYLAHSRRKVAQCAGCRAAWKEYQSKRRSRFGS